MNRIQPESSRIHDKLVDCVNGEETDATFWALAWILMQLIRASTAPDKTAQHFAGLLPRMVRGEYESRDNQSIH
jgi:hypothetical protein